MIEEDPESISLKRGLCTGASGWYIHEKYLEKYVEWLRQNVDENMKVEQKQILTFENNKHDGLLIFIQDEYLHSYSIQIFQRRNYHLLKDPDLKEMIDGKKYLMYKVGEKEKLNEIRNKIYTDLAIHVKGKKLVVCKYCVDEVKSYLTEFEFDSEPQSPHSKCSQVE
jgi:hypothetical protein